MPVPYTNIQYLAYELYTGPAKDAAGKQYYLGLDDDAADIKARCKVMERAMARALQLSGPADPTTLKVFMAPEFFFRGVTGAYPLSAAMGVGEFASGAGADVIGQLQDFASNPDYADWLFVFGTILATPDPELPAPVVAAQPPIKEIYNFSLVQAGGLPADGKGNGARIVMKKFKSPIDFIARADARAVAQGGREMLYDETVKHMTPYDPGWSLTELELAFVVGGEQQQVDEDGGAIFLSQGVTFGMEICLDHDNARLWQAQLPGQQLVQVQLVPSGGSKINNNNVIVGAGGQVFACDGLGHGTGIRPTALSVANGKKIVPVNVDPDPAGDDAKAAAALFPQSAYMDSAPASGRIYAYPKSAMPVQATVPGQARTLNWDFQQGDIEFSLIYDQQGLVSAARCRMGKQGGNMNHLLYSVPFAWPGSSDAASVTMTCAYVKLFGPHPKDRQGTVTVTGLRGAGKYAIACDIDIDGFAFTGIVMEFFADIKAGEPKTVGMAAK